MIGFHSGVFTIYHQSGDQENSTQKISTQENSTQEISTRVTPDKPLSPKALRRQKVAHIPEDRLATALIKEFSAYENMILGYQDRAIYNRGLFINQPAIIEDTRDKMVAFDVRPNNPYIPIKNLSGGNQQKLVIARELSSKPDLLIVGQPTRGVDIGAIEFIHDQIIQMRNCGVAVLLVSVELDEIRALSDRIVVMCQGELVGELDGEADEQTIGLMMANACVMEKGA